MKALVLSGGGSKGAFQIGVLKGLIANGAQYEIMTGVSVGALSVAGLGMFSNENSLEAISWLEQFWLTNVKPENIYKRWFPFGKLHSLWEKSVYNSQPLQKLVRKNYIHEKLIKSGKQISVGAVSLDTGEYRYVDQNDANFVEWILASSSYPVFFEPILIEGQYWSDGGIKGVTPLGQAVRMGADDIDVIMTSDPYGLSHWDASKGNALPDQALRVLDLMNQQIMVEDIKTVGLKNDLADLSDKYRHVKVRLFYPHSNLGSGLDFDPKQVRENIEIGFHESDSYEILE